MIMLHQEKHILTLAPYQNNRMFNFCQKFLRLDKKIEWENYYVIINMRFEWGTM